MADYVPSVYWENRLENEFNLVGVGNRVFSFKYNQYLYKAKVKILKNVIKNSKIILKDKKVLDVGCGTGFFIDFYSNMGIKKITGIDITEESIQKLSKIFPKFKFFVCDISKNALNSDFDIINVFDVMYHITSDTDFENAIKNCSKSLKAGGYIIITDKFNQKPGMNEGIHVKFRTFETYNKILRKNDISIIDIAPIFYLMNKTTRYKFINYYLNFFYFLLYNFDIFLRISKAPSNDIKILIGKKENDQADGADHSVS